MYHRHALAMVVGSAVAMGTMLSPARTGDMSGSPDKPQTPLEPKLTQPLGAAGARYLELRNSAATKTRLTAIYAQTLGEARAQGLSRKSFEQLFDRRKADLDGGLRREAAAAAP